MLFREAIDSVFTYVLAMFIIAFAFLQTHVSVIMTVGGVILLIVRLYTDVLKAYRAYKEHQEWNDYRSR